MKMQYNNETDKDVNETLSEPPYCLIPTDSRFVRQHPNWKETSNSDTFWQSRDEKCQKFYLHSPYNKWLYVTKTC